MATTELFAPQPTTLEGEHARLVPLAPEHAGALYEISRDEAIWRYLPCPPPATVEEMRGFISSALAEAERGLRLPFAILAKSSGQPAGSTSYLDIQRWHRTIEIGWTWVGTPYQRTALNTECKFLLFRHAFEDLGANRVSLKTDGRNLRSQAAIERIGAKREGTLRKHMRLPNGYVRDTVYFSVIAEEWPEVKARLRGMLEKPRS